MISKSFYGIPYMIGALFIALIGSLLADKVLIIQNMFICTSMATSYYVVWKYFKYKNVIKELFWGLLLSLGATVGYGIVMLCTLAWLDVAKHNGFFNFNFSIAGLFFVNYSFLVIQYLFAKTKWLQNCQLFKYHLIATVNIFITAFTFAFLALKSGQKIELSIITSTEPLTVYWYFLANTVVAVAGTCALLMFKRPLGNSEKCVSKKVYVGFKILKVSISVIYWLLIPFGSYILLTLLVNKIS